MASNVKKGAYYKSRTRKWLAEKGYEVVDMEVVRWVGTPAKRFPIKKDQLGSDLLAIRTDPDEIVLVQSKGGETARTGNFPQAVREFRKYKIPKSVKKWIVAWALRAKEPRVIDADVQELTEDVEEKLF